MIEVRHLTARDYEYALNSWRVFDEAHRDEAERYRKEPATLVCFECYKEFESNAVCPHCGYELPF